MVALAASAVLVALVHEPGRNLNMILIQALKGAGDVRFPVSVGIASNWGLAVLGAWLLGERLGLGLVGVWMAMAAEEWLRGIVMLLRWRSGVWQRKTLVHRADEASVAAVAPLAIEEGLSRPCGWTETSW